MVAGYRPIKVFYFPKYWIAFYTLCAVCFLYHFPNNLIELVQSVCQCSSELEAWIWWIDHSVDKKLTEWTQSVVVNGLLSNWRPVKCGVSQKLILGPALFNIFVSDMNSGIECAFSKFTNDTELHGAVDTLEERNAIQRYLERWAYVGHSTRPIQSPAPGSGQSQTQILAGQSMDWD